MTQAARLVLLAVLAALPVASARADATAQTVNPAGEKLYKSACVVCHASGAANAPSWATARSGRPTPPGADALLATVLTGRAHAAARRLLGGRGDPARGRGVHAKLGALIPHRRGRPGGGLSRRGLNRVAGLRPPP